MDYSAITNYDWDMGDGTTYSGAAYATVNHTYAVAGTYTVTCTVTNADGETATNTMPYSVGPTYTATKYNWIFDDGGSNGDTQKWEHFFAAPGYYHVTLEQEDADGQSSAVTRSFQYFENHVHQVKWDFGDGLTGTGIVAEHTYFPGVFTVKVEVIDVWGNKGEHTEVDLINVSGFLAGVSPTSGRAPLAVRCSAGL